MEVEAIGLGDMVGVVFKEAGVSSDMLKLNVVDARKLKASSLKAIEGESDGLSVFGCDKFSYIPQSNNTFLLSISVNDAFAKGYVVTNSQIKRLIATLKNVVKNIKVEEIEND